MEEGKDPLVMERRAGVQGREWECSPPPGYAVVGSAGPVELVKAVKMETEQATVLGAA